MPIEDKPTSATNPPGLISFAAVVTRPGLIWGLDFIGDEIRSVDDCDPSGSDGFRWMHFNLSDQGSHGWIQRSDQLSADVKELLLSTDNHQRALVDGATVGCILHDFEREFDEAEPSRTGMLCMALTPSLMITARHHPLRSPDIIRQRLMRSSVPLNAAGALDILASSLTEVLSTASRQLTVKVQSAEDAVLEGKHSGSQRDLMTIRRRIAQLHRMIGGMRAVFHRLEEDEDLPQYLLPTVEKFAQRLQGLDTDVIATQSQLRLLREELDIQSAQETNRNLYVLSIMTALMLPATLVTGLFGMNTGGLPWAGSSFGTFFATLLALGSSAAVYLLLRLIGLARR